MGEVHRHHNEKKRREVPASSMGSGLRALLAAALAAALACSTPRGGVDTVAKEASAAPGPPPSSTRASVAAAAAAPSLTLSNSAPGAWAQPSTPPDTSATSTARAVLSTPTGANAPGDRELEDGMLEVPAGPFVMGADAGGEDDEHPAHTVTLPGFFLDRTEVTNEAYEECVRAFACQSNDREVASRNHAGPDRGFQKPHQPVVGVSWFDAKAYCAFRGKRLPREAEFEKAMRDTDGRTYPWGKDAPTPERAVYGRQFGRDTTDDVGTHPAGRGPYGHDDLAGNVWEWMSDEYDPLAYTRPSAPEGKAAPCEVILKTLAQLRDRGAQGFTGSNPIPNECEHVLRGGAFNYFPTGLRGSNRVHHPGRFRLVMSGFRCAKDAAANRGGP